MGHTLEESHFRFVGTQQVIGDDEAIVYVPIPSRGPFGDSSSGGQRRAGGGVMRSGDSAVRPDDV